MNRQNARMDTMSDAQIIEALERLDQVLGRSGERAQIYLVGGAVMCLVHRARTATKDIDAWFSDPGVVRAAARIVAAELGLPDNWLNDAVKAFLPRNAGFNQWRSLPNLDISVADDRTLLAMKCAAARTTEDANDIQFLAARLGLSSSAEVLEVVLSYYPAEQLPVRTRLLLEEMLDDGE
ncbi:MAG: hypothetical protein AB1486_29605 [Planctomycetota bacterium]